MAFRIRTNVPALFAQRQLQTTNIRLNKTLERLSSGLRINKAADDAAGLAISERLRTQVLGLGQADRNAQDGVSLVQIAEGGLTQISDMLQRMRVLALQAANGTLTSNDRTLIQVEIGELISEVDRQVSVTKFNGKALLQTTQSFVFQVGANKGDTIRFTVSAVSTAGMKINNLKVTGASTLNATQAISSLDAAIDNLNSQRGRIGAIQNRLENAITFIGISIENMTAAESRIRDTDIAQDVVNFTRDQILAQTGTSMLAQANLQPQLALSLLQ